MRNRRKFWIKSVTGFGSNTIAYSAENTCLTWSKQFILCQGKRHPDDMGAAELLTHQLSPRFSQVPFGTGLSPLRRGA